MKILFIVLILGSFSCLASEGVKAFASCDNDQKGFGTDKVILIEDGESMNLYYYTKGSHNKAWCGISYQEDNINIEKTQYGSDRSKWDNVTIYSSKFRILDLIIYTDLAPKAIVKGKIARSEYGQGIECTYNVEVDLEAIPEC